MAKTKPANMNTRQAARYLDGLNKAYAKMARQHFDIEVLGEIDKCSELVEKLRCIADEIDGLNR